MEMIHSGALSLLPPLLAIVLALVLKEVVLSLFLGVLSGALVLRYYSGGWSEVPAAFLDVLDTYILRALVPADGSWDHMAIIIFSMLIGATVLLISQNGGMQGVVNILSRRAQTAKGGQLTTWLLGIVIFFDDYANTLVVGNTMRPLTDKLRISREKLSYIVDSTAAPVASIAFVTTWIGAELGYIKDGLKTLDIDQSAYSIFIGSLPYAFYPVLALLFILFLILQEKDFGPMHQAEVMVRSGKPTGAELDRVGGDADLYTARNPEKARAFNAVIPILVLVFGVLVSLIYTGWDPAVWNDPEHSLVNRISHLIGNANSYLALMWASMSAAAVALILTLAQRLMKLTDAVEVMVKGLGTMLPALVILVLAWSLAMITENLGTAQYLSSLLHGGFSPSLMPALTFVLAALTAFSTGSSWGTMAILYPLILPATWSLGMHAGLEHHEIMPLFLNAVNAVLAGSVLGDHCSPISDTTILSSLASNCNHIDHVRTQMPYALTVGGTALLLGTLPTSLGFPPWAGMLLGAAGLWFIVKWVGKPVPE